MKVVRYAAILVAALSSLVIDATAAHAQFSPALPPRSRVESGGARNRRSTSVIVYPVAPFVLNDPQGVATLAGGLIALETAFLPRADRPVSYAIGGWFWANGPSNLYDVHVKYYFKRDIGVQLGLVDTTKGGGKAKFDGFLLYNLTPDNTERNYWNFQVGAGFFHDPDVRSITNPGAGARKVTGFSGFVTGDTTLRKMKDRLLTLNVSYWYVEDAGRFNRVGIGLGYSF